MDGGHERQALSAHFEHTVVVTEDGCRVLTLLDDVAMDGDGPSRAQSADGRTASAAG